MSWLKALWSRIFSEDREKCTHIFQTICIEAGVSRKDLKNGNKKSASNCDRSADGDLISVDTKTATKT